MIKYLTTFIILLISISISIFAQELKDKKNNETLNHSKKIESVTATGDKITFKDESGNVLMEVTDEGDAGSIYLKSLPADINLFDNKLYNVGTELYWSGTPVMNSRSGGGWLSTGNGVILYENTDKVGIGVLIPSAKLHVLGDDGVLFEGTYGSGTIPKEGAGTRMIWYPKKAAFRVGSIDASQWDDANIGDYSIAMGIKTTASTTASTAMGYSTTASGFASTAMGYYSKAESYASTALGTFNVAGGTSGYWVDTDPLFEIGNGTDAANPTNAVTVLKNGNVGIGTGTTLANEVRLTVEGYDSYYALIKINQKGTKEYAGLSLQRSDTEKWFVGMDRNNDKLQFRNSASTNYMTIQENGNVGIGTENPSRKLYVNGSAGGTENWNASSDRRLKKNIGTIPDALEKLNKLRGVNFEWKDLENHSKGLKMGFIAQEAKEVIPEVVSKKGDYYSMQYAPITALLVEAVKEQQKTIVTQDIRIGKLEKENQDLKTVINENGNLKNEINIIKAALNRLVKDQQQIKLSSK